MTILQLLISEITQAMTAYQNEYTQKGKVISQERQQDIIKISQLLTASQQSDSDKSAYRLRQKLIKYIEEMPRNLLASLITVFDGSRLRQLLNTVLAKKEFSDSELLAQESIELREQQQKIGTAQNGDDLLARLDLMTEELKKKTEQALLAIKNSDYYNVTCTNLATRCQELINRNIELQTQLTEFHTKVSQELDELKAKLREQEQLIEKLNAENRQLRMDKEVERSRSFKIQKKLDKVTPQYAASLKIIDELQNLLKANDIPVPGIELQSLEARSNSESDSPFKRNGEIEFGYHLQ